jgi:hypothetical protein
MMSEAYSGCCRLLRTFQNRCRVGPSVTNTCFVLEWVVFDELELGVEYLGERLGVVPFDRQSSTPLGPVRCERRNNQSPSWG